MRVIIVAALAVLPLLAAAPSVSAAHVCVPGGVFTGYFCAGNWLDAQRWPCAGVYGSDENAPYAGQDYVGGCANPWNALP